MSQGESFQEKTEQATPKKLKDAQKKGTIARSRELTTTIVMLAGSGTLVISGSMMGNTLASTLTSSLTVTRAEIMDENFLTAHFANAVMSNLGALSPLLIILAVAAIGASIALGGWTFSPASLGFKAERISIPKGLKRIFSVRGLVELSKALAKFLLVGAAAVAWLWHMSSELSALAYESTQQALLHAGEICLTSLLLLSLTLILVAAVDVPFQLAQHSKKMRMTLQEVRDEQKDTDGRPEVKSRIRALQQQMANARMMEDVSDADVVITNPTHYAVAIKYDAGEMAAPIVIAKGKNLIAARIREIAAENDITLYSAPPLARVLYKTTKLGNPIPYELYRAVAQVLAYVFQMADFFKGQCPYPDRPELSVDEAAFGQDNATNREASS